MTCARTPTKANPPRRSLHLHGCCPNRQENLSLVQARCNSGIGTEWHLVTRTFKRLKDADSWTTSSESDRLSDVDDHRSRAKVTLRALTRACPVVRAELAVSSAVNLRWLPATSTSEGI
jgi:hypothetical protein